MASAHFAWVWPGFPQGVLGVAIVTFPGKGQSRGLFDGTQLPGASPKRQVLTAHGSAGFQPGAHSGSRRGGGGHGRGSAYSSANAMKEEDPDGGGRESSSTGMPWQAPRPTAPDPTAPEMCVSADGAQGSQSAACSLQKQPMEQTRISSAQPPMLRRSGRRQPSLTALCTRLTRDAIAVSCHRAS